MRLRLAFTLLPLLILAVFIAPALSDETGVGPISGSSTTINSYRDVALNGGFVVSEVGGFTEATLTDTLVVVIPAGATVSYADLYISFFLLDSGERSVTFAGNSLGDPYLSLIGSSQEWSTVRISVGAIVTGSGSYSITVSSVGGSSGVYGAALVVVYSQVTEPFTRIIMQDGAEFIRADLGNSPYRVSFSSVSTTSATAASLTVMAQAGQPASTRPDERDELRVGSVVIDNDPFRSDDGYLWDLNSWNVFAQLESTVDVDFYESGTQPPGLNGYAIDFVLLAVTYAAPFPGVPEFSLGLPMMTSLALVLFMAVEKRFGKRKK